MSFKRLFSRSLGAAPGRLHLAAHSHHLWPDASFMGQLACWEDAARLADRKWDRVMGEVWLEAQARVATELGGGAPNTIVFAGNTHDLLIRLAAACPREQDALRILTTDGEFHSAERQLARWEESGEAVVTRIATDPFEDFDQRFGEAAAQGGHDLIILSHLMFGTGRIASIDAVAALGNPNGPWVVIDGYHSFMAVPKPFPDAYASHAFFLGGGYKYAMAGEGCAFMHCPPGFGLRPPITGWYAEFDEAGLAPGQVGYAPDAMRFMGATFDPSGLYRFTAVQHMLADEGLTTEITSRHVATLQERLIDALAGSRFGAAELLNPLTGGPHARFLAFRSPDAARWCDELMHEGCVTNVRGEVLRIGLGLYHDADDIDRFAAIAAGLR